VPAGILLAALPLATGAALVVYIVYNVPMASAVALFAAAGAVAWTVVYPRLTAPGRAWVRAAVGRGVVAGPLAILAYDATRYGVVALASMSFQPFHVFPRFGQALVGPGLDEGTATLLGVLFHLANGIGFAVAYALVVRRSTVARGVAWALALETAMLLLYPGWLGVSLAGELLPVSLCGHLAYGAVLGRACARLER
jgi:hypothetical protein